MDKTEPSADSAAPTEKVFEKQVLSFGSGSTSGAYYPVAGGLAQVINESIPNINCIVEATGGSVENVRRVNAGDLQFGLANDFLLYYAFYDDPSGTFSADEDFSNLVAVATNHASLTALVVPANSDINSLADVVGKSVSVGAPGSSNYITAMNILSVYGITEDNIKARHESFSETVESFKQGLVDCFIAQGGTPLSSVIEITNSVDCRIIPIDDEHMAMILEKYPFYFKSDISADTYKGQDNPVQTIKTWNTIFTTKDFDYDLLYAIMEAWYDDGNLEYLKTVHNSLKDMNLQEAPNVTIPLHPAAEQFFKDKGVLD